MIQTHINTNNTDFTYTNTTDLGQNIFVTGTGGAGNINTSTYDSGHTRYYNQGAVGVALQIFVDDTLCESISGGDGNIVSVADIYKHVRTENHRRKYSCGFLGLKTCWRDNWVQIWEWGHNRQSVTHRAEGQTKSFVLNIPPQSTLKVKFVGSSDSEFKGSVSISLHNRQSVTHRAEGQTKSFVLNIPPQSTLKVKFVGSSDSEFKGSVSISLLDNPLSIPFKPIDLDGLEGLVEKIPEPLPEVEPSPKPPETELPEVDSNENPDDTEQGGDSSQENGNTDGDSSQENTENENPPIVEPESPQEQEPSISAEMINDFLAFIDNFNTFAINNPTIQIDESKDLTDHFYNLTRQSPAYTSFVYESGFKRLMLYEAISFVLDDIMQSTTPELVEFFSTMPQTTHNNGDLKELSIYKMRQELQSLQAQSE